MTSTQPTHSPSLKPTPWALRLIDRCVIKLFTLTLNNLSSSVRYLPKVRRRIQKLQVIKDIPFGPDKQHTLDMYAPQNVTLPDRSDLEQLYQRKISSQDAASTTHRAKEELDTPGRYPFALYLHGGGFVTFSKDSHWPFGVRLAEAGFVTFLINYRLSIDEPCPAALEDCAIALSWILDHANELNLNLDQCMITGESAGGNLTLALLLCLLRRDTLPWASDLFDRGWLRRMAVPACAFLDVSCAERLADEMNPFFLWRIKALGRRYLFKSERPDLGEPLSELVQGAKLARPCPPVFIPIGDNDPVYRDSILLAKELAHRDIPHRLTIYPRGIHAFHAAIHMSLAEKCWRDHWSYWRECGGELITDQCDKDNEPEDVT